jgi:peptide/nickel transport system ATP-binding protein
MSVENPGLEGLTLDHVTKLYPARGRKGAPPVTAVDDVTFTIPRGGAVGLIGQSGSGKTTIARLITGIEKPTSGTITQGGARVDLLRARELREYRRGVQLVFQDPYAALNPTSRISYILSRPLINYERLGHDEARDRVRSLLASVGLTPPQQFESKLPHQLSGGQRQRVVIARALACKPRLIVADEPVSMLDVSLRAGVLELLGEIRRTEELSLLYITHDLLGARAIADELIVLHHGRVVEAGAARTVLQAPRDPYTRSLIDALPDPRRATRIAKRGNELQPITRTEER